MSMQDHIADMLTRIRNASRAKHVSVMVKNTNMNRSILEVLVAQGYIANYRVDDERQLVVELKYDSDGRSVIQMIERVSKPSRRIYEKFRQLRSVMGGLGIVIVSTSKGMMTGREARRQGLGGEVICQVS